MAELNESGFGGLSEEDLAKIGENIGAVAASLAGGAANPGGQPRGQQEASGLAGAIQ